MRLLRARPPKVEKLKRKGNVDGLVRALSYEDPVTDRDGRFMDLGTGLRTAAAEALAGMEGRAAFDGLLRALGDPEESVRIVAVRGLRERGDPLAAEQLTSAVTNWTQPEFARARQEALEALAFLRDPTAPRRLVAGLLTRAGDLDEEADSRVLRRLTQAGGHDALAGTIEDLVARLREGSAPERARPLLVWLAPESVEPLIRALDDHIAQREAIIALGSIHDSRAVEKLCSILLGDDDPPIRMAAAWALGEIRDPAAVEALLVATGDGDYRVRAEAGVSFDKLGNAAIAVAMSALIRPALENGAAPPTDAIAADDEGPALPEGSVEEPEPESAPVPQPARPQPRPSQPTAITRAEPVLRRLLGRRSNP